MSSGLSALPVDELKLPIIVLAIAFIFMLVAQARGKKAIQEGKHPDSDPLGKFCAGLGLISFFIGIISILMVLA